MSTKWKLSATRKVTSTSTLSSIFNPRKPLNMIGNKNKSTVSKSMSKPSSMSKSSSAYSVVKNKLSPSDVSSGYGSGSKNDGKKKKEQ